MAYLTLLASIVGWELLLTCVAIILSVTWYIRSYILPIAPNLPPGPPRIPPPFHLIAAAKMLKKGIQPLFDMQQE